MVRSYDDLQARVRETRLWIFRIRRMAREEGLGLIVETKELLDGDDVTENEDEEVLPGMTLRQINKKHFHLRGTLDLKYPPRDQVCKAPCGFKDLCEPGEPPRDHVCVLAKGHKSECRFSWECKAHATKISH